LGPLINYKFYFTAQIAVLYAIYSILGGYRNKLSNLEIELSSVKKQLNFIPSIPPVKGKISSGFGKRVSGKKSIKRPHEGIDIAAKLGSNILASASGVVEERKYSKSYGNYVLINHSNGLKTRYAHNSSTRVKLGQRVRGGDKIAKVGKSGRASGAHLHYEVILNNIPVNPINYISF